MNEQGTFIAALLDTSGRAYASSTVLRLDESGSQGQNLVQSLGFQALISEVEGRIQCLAEALATGCPEVFTRDTRWLMEMHAARSVPTTLVPALLQHLKEELLESLPAPHGAMAAEYVQSAIDADLAPGKPENDPSHSTPHKDTIEAFLRAILEGDAEEAEQLLLKAMDSGTDPANLHHQIITPAQRRMGEMWHHNEISVATEHLGSRTVERVLANIRNRMTRDQTLGRKALLASVPGNLHDIGLRVVSDQFWLEGWAPIFLGANMPVDDLAHAAQEHQPDLVLLGAGLSTHLRSTANCIQAIREACPNLPILVGGGPFTAVPDLWKAVGADASASSASEAVATAKRLTDGTPESPAQVPG